MPTPMRGCATQKSMAIPTTMPETEPNVMNRPTREETVGQTTA